MAAFRDVLLKALGSNEKYIRAQKEVSTYKEKNPLLLLGN